MKKTIKVVPFITAMTDKYNSKPAPNMEAILDNIVDTSDPRFKNCVIGSYIYRSYEGGVIVPYWKHIKPFTEMNSGGHYYVMSEYSHSHSIATARVKLSEATCLRAGNRNGFISLSIYTGQEPMSQCDIGIGYLDGNQGEGWYPSSWSRDMSNKTDVVNITPDSSTGFEVGYTKGTKITASEIEIEIEVKKSGGYDWVYGRIYKVVGGNRESSPFASITYRGVNGNFFPTNYTTPHVRFTRFMSLVPLDEYCERDVYCTDYADGSWLNGTMRDCKIDGKTWNKDKIAFAWSVQGANIQTLQIGDITGKATDAGIDIIKIREDVNTHGTPFEIVVDV